MLIALLFNIKVVQDVGREGEFHTRPSLRCCYTCVYWTGLSKPVFGLRQTNIGFETILMLSLTENINYLMP